MTELARDLPRLPPAPGSTRTGDGLPRRKWSVSDLERMLEAGIMGADDRFELLGGDLVAMAAKGRHHEVLKIALADFWIRARPPEIRVAQETPLRLDEHWEPEPDFIVYPATLLAPDVRGGTVLLVVEIGDASLGDDHRIKAPMYARYGVCEYWIIDARRRLTALHREPTPTGYASRVELPGEALMTPQLAPGLAVRLADLDHA